MVCYLSSYIFLASLSNVYIMVYLMFKQISIWQASFLFRQFSKKDNQGNQEEVIVFLCIQERTICWRMNKYNLVLLVSAIALNLILHLDIYVYKYIYHALFWSCCAWQWNRAHFDYPRKIFIWITKIKYLYEWFEKEVFKTTKEVCNLK